MSKPQRKPLPKPIVDQYGNRHHLGEELARGGQGVVFRTTDADLAIKQPLDASGKPDKNANLRERFQDIRRLPLPSRIRISLPLAILRDESGYVMRLLNDMKPFESFEMNGTTQNELKDAIDNGSLESPKWLAGIPDEKLRLRLFHYARTGSTRRRLSALTKCACILARLHFEGLVYGDISPNNVFLGKGDSPDVWLIDADNLRFEMGEGGSAVFTPHYGAPEIVQGLDCARPRTDCWAFAVLAFKSLALSHPFIGRKVLEPDDEEGGWDADPPVAEEETADLDEQAYAGYLPFIDDEEDDSNPGVGGLPRVLVATSQLRRLFQETFVPGRTQPHRRPAMAFWGIALARAFDQSIVCPDCKMSYYVSDFEKCPYCQSPRPAFARAKTPRWEVVISTDATEFSFPHRLFHPFSIEHHDDAEYQAVFDFGKKTAQSIRGTQSFPPDLSIEFVEAAT